MAKGLLIILSGPSGVGKGTVRKLLLKNYNLDFTYSISMTTRAPRNREVNGVDYYFVSREEFMENVKNNNFLEWAEFVGNCYGTPKDKVEELRNQGKNVFLEIEIQGATQILENHKDEGVVSFYLMPPSLKALEERIKRRNTESEEVIQQRLKKAEKEMTMAGAYDYIVMNDRVGDATRKIAKLIYKKIKQTSGTN